MPKVSVYNIIRLTCGKTFPPISVSTCLELSTFPYVKLNILSSISLQGFLPIAWTSLTKLTISSVFYCNDKQFLLQAAFRISLTAIADCIMREINLHFIWSIRSGHWKSLQRYSLNVGVNEAKNISYFWRPVNNIVNYSIRLHAVVYVHIIFR